MIIAGVIGPSPFTSVNDVPDAETAAAMRRLETFIWSLRRSIIDQVACDLETLASHRLGRCESRLAQRTVAALLVCWVPVGSTTRSVRGGERPVMRRS